MKKDKLNAELRKLVKEKLSPTQEDRDFVAKIYKSFNDLLGVNNCIQIGSFPRFTAVRPLHDLDILYIIGEWANSDIIPAKQLKILADKFRKEYINPTNYKITVTVQTHSISFKYLNYNNEEVFAVDIVPALKDGINEFGRNKFRVPEIIKIKRGRSRDDYYQSKILKHQNITWIKTDPIGYIEVSTKINQENEDFRRSVKFVKGWKNECKKMNDNFKLKSFHLEQLITEDYLKNLHLDIFDSIFIFFTNLKSNIQKPRISDRADSSRYIDQYLTELNQEQMQIINQAVDAILIRFENVETESDVRNILTSGFYKRNEESEKFLFDDKIPVLVDEDLLFQIAGVVSNYGTHNIYNPTLSSLGSIIDKNNSINFIVVKDNSSSDLIKWKVKNDNSSPQPRGEITNYKTFNNSETTAYIGKHYVEAYSIRNNVCIAKDKIDVIVYK